MSPLRRRRFECRHGSIEIVPLHYQCAFRTEQRDYIARNYGGCLCHHCLENITTEPHPVSVRELANFLLDWLRT
ncbi:MAG: hypothetical protein ACLR8Y_02480 [Alistipes indistinctus]